MSTRTSAGGYPLPKATDAYPLKIEPSFRERIWGRKNLSFFNPNLTANPSSIGEVWLTADTNTIANGAWAGRTLGDCCRSSPKAVLGYEIQESDTAGSAAFPLLVKFIFTTDKLSVQVHPPEDYARQNERCSGKTEMWHVLDVQPGSRLAIGFREELIQDAAFNREFIRSAAENGKIKEMLNWIDVRSGDTFFVPAGTVHAIGEGLVLCEIQQNSDITYRLYDYNRPGSDGLPRPLHLDKALDVIDWRWKGGSTKPLEFNGDGFGRSCLAACPFFATEKISLNRPIGFSTLGRFEIWIGIDGEAIIETASVRVSLQRGEAVIVPAGVDAFSVIPNSHCVFLRSYQPVLDRDIIAPLLNRGFSMEQLSQVCFPVESKT